MLIDKSRPGDKSGLVVVEVPVVTGEEEIRARGLFLSPNQILSRFSSPVN